MVCENLKMLLSDFQNAHDDLNELDCAIRNLYDDVGNYQPAVFKVLLEALITAAVRKKMAWLKIRENGFNGSEKDALCVDLR